MALLSLKSLEKKAHQNDHQKLDFAASEAKDNGNLTYLKVTIVSGYLI